MAAATPPTDPACFSIRKVPPVFVDVLAGHVHRRTCIARPSPDRDAPSASARLPRFSSPQMNVSVRPGGGSALRRDRLMQRHARARTTSRIRCHRRWRRAPGCARPSRSARAASTVPGISTTSDAARAVVERRLRRRPSRERARPSSRSRIRRRRAPARLEAERLDVRRRTERAPLEDVPLIGRRELRRIVGPDIRRDRRRDDADRRRAPSPPAARAGRRRRDPSTTAPLTSLPS